jgi:hypothetical protein
MGSASEHGVSQVPLEGLRAFDRRLEPSHSISLTVLHSIGEGPHDRSNDHLVGVERQRERMEGRVEVAFVAKSSLTGAWKPGAPGFGYDRDAAGFVTEGVESAGVTVDLARLIRPFHGHGAEDRADMVEVRPLRRDVHRPENALTSIHDEPIRHGWNEDGNRPFELGRDVPFGYELAMRYDPTAGCKGPVDREPDSSIHERRQHRRLWISHLNSSEAGTDWQADSTSRSRRLEAAEAAFVRRRESEPAGSFLS